METFERHRRAADDLIDDRDRAARTVEIGDRQRDALAVLVRAHDHELPRLTLARHIRRRDPHQ